MEKISKHSSIPNINIFIEIIIRVLLFIIFWELEYTSPFIRKIHYDELWLYKNPTTASYFSTTLLVSMLLFIPFLFVIYYFFKKCKIDLTQTTLAISLAYGLNGVITDAIKLVVGRPRPDFLSRCFPRGIPEIDNDRDLDVGSLCKGNHLAIMEGRKSFPSGHSSFAFCSLGFLSLWLYGKLKVFSHQKGEQGWKLVISTFPLMCALFIALSRTCDYHHHWQDVLIGSMIGLLISWSCYRQYYPSLSSPYCHLSYSKKATMNIEDDIHLLNIKAV